MKERFNKIVEDKSGITKEEECNQRLILRTSEIAEGLPRGKRGMIIEDEEGRGYWVRVSEWSYSMASGRIARVDQKNDGLFIQVTDRETEDWLKFSHAPSRGCFIERGWGADSKTALPITFENLIFFYDVIRRVESSS